MSNKNCFYQSLILTFVLGDVVLWKTSCWPTRTWAHLWSREVATWWLSSWSIFFKYKIGYNLRRLHHETKVITASRWLWCEDKSSLSLNRLGPVGISNERSKFFSWYFSLSEAFAFHVIPIRLKFEFIHLKLKNKLTSQESSS